MTTLPPVAPASADPAGAAQLLIAYETTLLTAQRVDGQWWLTKQDRQALSTSLEPVLETLTQHGWQPAIEWQDDYRYLVLLKREREAAGAAQDGGDTG